jgi:hypothetical protein
MNQLWANSKQLNVVYNGENIRSFRFKPSQGSYNLAQVYQRADALRKRVEEDYPGEYSMSVAVRDRHVGGWRSGKYRLTADPDIYIFTPEEYDKEFNHISGQIKLPDLVAEDLVIYLKREMKAPK